MKIETSCLVEVQSRDDISILNLALRKGNVVKTFLPFCMKGASALDSGSSWFKRAFSLAAL